MSHTDPVFAIPVGAVIAVASIYAALHPERFLELHSGGLQRLFGDRGATLVLRVSALVTAALTGWLVIHAWLSLIWI